VNVLTPTEAADKLKVKPITIIRLFDAGILPGVVLRQGARKRVIRFSEEAIEKFLTSREKRGSRVEVERAARAND
jgi:predicted site-specific integrase-resolvase